MDASGFGTLASYFTDRMVVTYDPRGVSRSERTTGADESTPEEHADDLHRLIAALDAEPEDFGLPTEDDGSRDDVMFGQNLRTITR